MSSGRSGGSGSSAIGESEGTEGSEGYSEYEEDGAAPAGHGQYGHGHGHGGGNDTLGNRMAAEKSRLEAEMNEKREILYQMDLFAGAVRRQLEKRIILTA
jgi:hypothetical protein